MCTVTFIPKFDNSFILTSNRDEAPDRKTIYPKRYNVEGAGLVFPKDQLAGGTWFGWSTKKRVICMLNGGVTAHERKSAYRMSRGIVVTDLLASEDILIAVNAYNFEGIEPFTLVVVDWNNALALYELVWNGDVLNFSNKPLEPTIWSSSLLYSNKVKEKREAWFLEFLFENENPSESSLQEFHKTAGEGSSENDLIIDRGFVKTKSITQLSKSKYVNLRHEDLQRNQVHAIEGLDNEILKTTST